MKDNQEAHVLSGAFTVQGNKHIDLRRNGLSVCTEMILEEIYKIESAIKIRDECNRRDKILLDNYKQVVKHRNKSEKKAQKKE